MLPAFNFTPAILLILCLAMASCAKEPDPWQPLFNGSDLSNWKHYLSKPDKTIDVPGLPRDSTGAYQQPGRGRLHEALL